MKLWPRIGELTDKQISAGVLAFCTLVTLACLLAVAWCCLLKNYVPR
jgi:hypothetical protein